MAPTHARVRTLDSPKILVRSASAGLRPGWFARLARSILLTAGGVILVQGNAVASDRVFETDVEGETVRVTYDPATGLARATNPDGQCVSDEVVSKGVRETILDDDEKRALASAAAEQADCRPDPLFYRRALIEIASMTDLEAAAAVANFSETTKSGDQLATVLGLALSNGSPLARNISRVAKLPVRVPSETLDAAGKIFHVASRLSGDVATTYQLLASLTVAAHERLETIRAAAKDDCPAIATGAENLIRREASSLLELGGAMEAGLDYASIAADLLGGAEWVFKNLPTGARIFHALGQRGHVKAGKATRRFLFVLSESIGFAKVATGYAFQDAMAAVEIGAVVGRAMAAGTVEPLPVALTVAHYALYIAAVDGLKAPHQSLLTTIVFGLALHGRPVIATLEQARDEHLETARAWMTGSNVGLAQRLRATCALPSKDGAVAPVMVKANKSSTPKAVPTLRSSLRARLMQALHRKKGAKP